ncbi:MAG: hypothetical protein QM617_01430 [Comamonas sp.]
MKALILLALAALALPQPPAHAQAGQVFRCGNEYTNDAKSAASRGCKPIEGGNVSIIQSAPPANPSWTGRTGPTPPTSRQDSVPSSSRIDNSLQRSRDQQARQVLDAELEKSRARLRDLQAEYKEGTPDRLGSERNYQRYLERTAELKANIERTQSDITGIERELARLPAHD